MHISKQRGWAKPNLDKIKSRFRQLLQDDRGQTTAEYILILAVVVMIAMKFKNTFGARLDTLTGKIGNKIDGAIDE